MNQKYLDQLWQDMRLKNFTTSTMESYLAFVRRFLDFFGQDAMQISYSDIRSYIFYMKDVEKKKPATINCYTAAIRFFCEYTLGFIWNSRKVPKMKLDRKLPVILTREEVDTLINSFDNLKHKAIVATMYSSGMRVGEVCRLKYEDILKTRKQIYIRNAKNREDRYAILSERNLEILTEYWFCYDRPRDWLFPSPITGGPLTTAAVEAFMKDQIMKLGFSKHATPHTMRHSFAVHMLEDGNSHTCIQQLLGHRSPSSTDHYLQMTSKALMGLRSPFDSMGDQI